MSAAERGPVRVAVIGAGQMANLVHYPSLTSLADVEVVGICDLSAERLRETGERWGITALFSDWSLMIDETHPEAVYVIGPPELMFGIWCACLVRGLDLFVEKPLGLTLHQARTLARLADENGCVTQVGFQRRSSPLLGRMVARVRERGQVVHAVCRFYKSDPTPMVSARDRMMDDGVHVIDTLRHLCGGEVLAVSDVTRRVKVDDINVIAATLEFDTGAVGVMIANWTSGRRTFGVEVHGVGIMAEADLEVGGTVWDADGQEDLDAAEVAGSADLHVRGGFRDKSAEFIEAVRTRRLPSSHFGDALKTMTVAETILAHDLLRGADCTKRLALGEGY
ncbi:Gfo/Idh/MocA family protein [Microbacterium sp.]|uniref:Gfo/Idh/MocA family protein n=1 Tax=Microbacterium sp. TaxID=51671 RepID=UPI0009285527|nr:Gfo/Idh/MocA family oxidoreductase [Microbacterium sp.]MBN9189725.1 Gfo/Idh/MocA family oxidoreductase [Microbacterium sp.]MBN9192513.1 Gfo/Idh/MocA family oxidoreductase [Microbacterium sp.]OJU59353.1 MAG: dehydrogenase [Microbacterium sp. 70-38]